MQGSLPKQGEKRGAPKPPPRKKKSRHFQKQIYHFDVAKSKYSPFIFNRLECLLIKTLCAPLSVHAAFSCDYCIDMSCEGIKSESCRCSCGLDGSSSIRLQHVLHFLQLLLGGVIRDPGPFLLIGGPMETLGTLQSLNIKIRNV